MNNNYQILITKLDAFIRKYYKNRLLKGTIYSLGLLLSAFILFTSVEYFGQFNTLGRTILFYTFLAITSYLFISFIIIPLAHLYRFGKIINHKQAAQIIGNHFDEVKDKLINVLQLESKISSNSNELLLASIEQKSYELNPIPFSHAVNLNENKKYLKYLFLPLLFITVIGFISPRIFTDGTSRLVNHNTYIAPIAPFQFNVNNTELQVLKNNDFTLEVDITGKQLPHKIYIQKKGNKYPLTKIKNRTYSYTFKNVQQNEEFKIYASNFYSENYELQVIPNPILTRFSIDIDYPRYLSKPNETIENTGDLILPEGTKLKWNIRTEDADFLNFLVDDSSYLLNPVDRTFHFAKTAYQNQGYAFVPSNRFVPQGDTVHYALQVIKDKYPTIKMDERIDSTDQNRIYFKGEIADDYGFTRLNFNYQILTPIDSLPLRNKTQSIDIPISLSTSIDEFFHFWNMEEINLLPGDEIMYYFEVWDNDGVNGKKSSKSTVKTFKAKSIKERNTATDANNQNIKKELSASIKDAQQLQKELEDFRKKLSEKKKIDWDEKQKLKDLIEKQKELEKKVNEIQQQNKQNNQQQNEYKQFNEELLQKQELLEQLFEELMTDEMKEMMDKLEEMMDKLNKSTLEQELEKMDLSNQDLEKELDRSLELFKQMEFEQKLDEVKNKLDKLAEKQDDLSENSLSKKENAEELKNKQDQLNEEFNDVKKDLEELQKMDDELEKPNGMENTKPQEEQIDEAMQKSSEQLEKKKKKKAAESQKKAAEEMKKIAQNMAEMQASMEGSEEDMEALRQLLDNLLHLSFEQENLMKKYEKVDKKSPEYIQLTQQQKKLKDDAKMVKDSLFALSKRVVELQSTINKEINAINSNMDKTIELMAERLNPMAVARQQYTMTSINNLALLLDEILQQMQQQARSKPGQGSCEKPGGNGPPKPGMGTVKKMQQQLSEQLKAMEKALKEGKQPKGQKPGEQDGTGVPGGKGMSKSLAKMAAQQAKVRNALQKLKNEGAKGTNGLSKLMEQNERDIVNKRINQQTIDRQKQILTRLLESEKAELEREWDEKRESQEGKSSEKRNPELFFEYKNAKQKEVDLLKTTPPNLNTFYKRKVAQYFQNLDK